MTSEQRAILIRAAEIEAAKQNAIRAGEIRVVTALDRELARLWRRFSELDARTSLVP